jgi:hypothetical protein
MTIAEIKFYYWSALVVSVTIFAEMAVAKYRGLVLPSMLMCVILVAFAGILLGDWLVQYFVKHRIPE